MSISGNPFVLAAPECEDIIRYLDIVDAKDMWSPSTDPYWYRRTIEIKDIHDPHCLAVLQKAYRTIRSALPEGYEASSCRIVVWNEGSYADLHTDDIFVGREWSSIVYLNENFTGGFTDFPNQKVAIQPKTGMGVVFQGDSKHPHKVTEILSGTRYALTGFWTADPEHMAYKGWA